MRTAHEVFRSRIADTCMAITRGTDPGVGCLCFAAMVLWYRGYGDQAQQRMLEALNLARAISHPLSLSAAFNFAARVGQFRREVQ